MDFRKIPTFLLIFAHKKNAVLRKLQIKKSLKKILRSPKLLLLAATILVLCTTLLFANKGIWRHIALHTDVSSLSQKDVSLTDEEMLLIKKVDKLSSEDPNLIERIAREKYHMKRTGEIIYRQEQK